AELDAISTKLNDSRTIAADIDRFRQEMVLLEARLNKAIMQLPNEKEIPELIKSVSDAAGDVGMKILLFRPKKEVLKGFYADVPVDMVVEGGFESLFSFCDKVGRFPRIVNVADISTMTKTERAVSPMLESKFVVTTFRFISDSTEKTAEKKGQ
ncbi:MAG: type 4a pilus biogenesis protein PilO, partial [Deltaproteobacteria bacterium]|nr:type 4a pilus biogenesis protein PilO [Deltaproteobacteria bacterium]